MGKTAITLRSSNKKTGPMPVSISSADTCPHACPLSKARSEAAGKQGGGCYAETGPLSWHWKKVTQGLVGLEYNEFLDTIRGLPENTIWRHNQAGDLPGIGDVLDTNALAALVDANRGKRGYTYTHKPLVGSAERESISRANKRGFTVNLSGNNPAHADELAELDIAPVTTLVPLGTPVKSLTPAGRTIIRCPAETSKVNCKECGACAVPGRKSIIGFTVHGTRARVANEIAKGDISITDITDAA